MVYICWLIDTVLYPNRMSRGFRNTLLFAVSLFIASCSSTKYVPDGAYLLDEVKITSDTKYIKPSALQIYVRQNPNSKWFSLVKTQLHVYNMSGRDSTGWNRMLRRIGDAPAVYDESDARRSQEEMKKAVHNMGYMEGTVNLDIKTKKKKLKLCYEVIAGRPYVVDSLHYDIDDTKIAGFLRADSVHSLLKEGMLFDVNVLDAERQRITELLLRNGYYKFNKDYIDYVADTIQGTRKVNLTMHVDQYRPARVGEPARDHVQYKVNKVSFITDYDMLQSNALDAIHINDSLHYKGYPIYFKDNLYLRPKVLTANLRIRPGELYDVRDVERTYTNFGRLPALKYTNMRFTEVLSTDSALLNCYVLLTKNKPKSISFEVEGTNSAGDLGAAASIAYQHRNLFKGSETFMFKVRGAYEAITGLQGDYHSNNYTEYGAEASINFPRFLFPFLTADFRQRMRASTELGLQYTYQVRPEFSRTIASASWSYKWAQRQRAQHRFDLLDVSYIYFPWISDAFKQKYIDKGQQYILEYNYKNQLIVRMGYNYHYNSSGAALINNTIANNSYSIRANIESAGNLLCVLSSALDVRKNKDNEYAILGIPFAQYLKGEFDFARNVVIDPRNSLAFHAGVGIAVPYGNARTIPFEKQYFSGGANSVRGWTVRELGPGCFPGDNNLLNQSGDIKFDASIEYRTRLFWKFLGAVFVDAGNIWTIRDYENTPGGVFKFDSFYKQIAVAYGIGLRLDIDFFILRFDGGMKAINPAKGKEHYPIIHPKFSRDFAFHFAVGYPF